MNTYLTIWGNGTITVNVCSSRQQLRTELENECPALSLEAGSTLVKTYLIPAGNAIEIKYSASEELILRIRRSDGSHINPHQLELVDLDVSTQVQKGSKRPSLTATQQSILDYIRMYRDDHGIPPSMREIQTTFGYKSQTTAVNHLKLMENKGYIKRQLGKARSIKIIDP